MENEVLFYEKHSIQVVPINEEVLNRCDEFHRDPSIFEMLSLIAEFPLKYQLILMANLLTISGFKESELAEEMGRLSERLKRDPVEYRRLLSDARKQFKDKQVTEL